ncbi:MAG: hypothetical protein Q9169_004050 [Polycauliona sp. 2 TL-2023]
MAARPTLTDLRSKSYDTTKSGLPSPRITHFDGDIPPQMSPLDAFAAQSRMLARKLDDSKRNGRRVSRLPPLTIAESLVKPASGASRSRSAESPNVVNLISPRAHHDAMPPSNLPELEEPSFRPKSFYPRFSRISSDGEEGNGEADSPRETAQQLYNSQDAGPRSVTLPQSPNEHFATPRVASPEPLGPVRNGIKGRPGSPIWTQQQRPASPQILARPSFDQTHRRADAQQRGLSVESASSPGSTPNALALPKSPHLRQAASIRSVPMDSSDEELSASTGGSSFSQHRKQSSSSGVSVPRSPYSSFTQAHARSPSLNSEYSIGGSRLVRPTLNFSRPLSRGSSRPSMEMASRQPSFDSRPSFDYNSRQPSSDSQHFILADPYSYATVSPEQEHYFDSKEHPDAPAPSYIYTKFSLPRGRILQRNSKVLENQQMPHFEWEQPAVATNVAPVSPPLDEKGPSVRASPPQQPKTSLDRMHSSPRPSFEKSRLGPNRPPIKPLSTDTPSSSSASMRSGSTIKARPNQPGASTQDLTSEDHLAKGIASHEAGNFKESTYHLRIAAKANLPTAMLLYALACRHGWGMRPNPSEGVQWLRRAADCASLEIADDEDGKKEGKTADVIQQKTRRAQFALSIYELGVSHMNGWGIEQDKALALRCFEIAGNWGDADAMAEAGFCYTQGAGCKKDLMKAAKWYRMAEAKGMSMVGNSWIYKPKYADDGGDGCRKGRKEKPTTPEKKPRDKSRTRTIFGRKKSISQR